MDYKYYKFKLNWIFKTYEIRSLKKLIGVIAFNNLKEINYLNRDYKKINDYNTYINRDYKKFFNQLKKDLENKKIEYIELIV